MKNISNLNYINRTPPTGISWKAIFAGTIAALSLMLILNLIGMAFGMFSIEPTEESNPLSGLGTGAVIWWVISNLIVLFIGGFVAARVGNSFKDISGILQGIMTWSLYALISAWMVTSVLGSIISGVGNAVGGVLSSTGQVVQDQLGPVIKEQFDGLEVSLDDAREEFYSLLEDTGKEELDPENLESKAENSVEDAREGVTRNQSGRADVERIFNKSKNRFEQSFEALDKQALINVLVARTDMTESEARQAVDNTFAEFERAREEFEAFMQETEVKVREKAENIAEAVGRASMYLAIALILGLIAAALGGFLGVKNLREDSIENDYLEDDETDRDFDRSKLGNE